MNEQEQIKRFFIVMNYLKKAGRQLRYIRAINQVGVCLMEAEIEHDA